MTSTCAIELIQEAYDIKSSSPALLVTRHSARTLNRRSERTEAPLGTPAAALWTSAMLTPLSLFLPDST